MGERSRGGSAKDDQVSSLYKRYAKPVYGFACKFFQGDDVAKEIVQDTFQDVFTQFDRDFAGKPLKRIEALIFTIARRRAIDYLRRAHPERWVSTDTISGWLEQCSDSDNPADHTIHKLTMDRLWRVLSGHLTGTEHAVAVLSWDIGLPDYLIAELLGIGSPATVRSHRSRAKTKIKRALGEAITFPEDPGDLNKVDGEECQHGTRDKANNSASISSSGRPPGGEE